MIRKFCDVCDKEIKYETFKIIIQMKEPKETAVIIEDVCRECANKCMDIIDPHKTISRGCKKTNTDPLDLSFSPDTNEEMLNRASKVHYNNQPIVDPIFESINDIRKNY